VIVKRSIEIGDGGQFAGAHAEPENDLLFLIFGGIEDLEKESLQWWIPPDNDFQRIPAQVISARVRLL
jgi:hypothetical protein